MALIIEGKTTCALCDKVLCAEDDIVATSHFIGDRTDPLWEYSDAPFHKQCFLSWDHRSEFIAKYNRACKDVFFGDGFFHQMEDDGSIISVRKTTV